MSAPSNLLTKDEFRTWLDNVYYPNQEKLVVAVQDVKNTLQVLKNHNESTNKIVRKWDGRFYGVVVLILGDALLTTVDLLVHLGH